MDKQNKTKRAFMETVQCVWGLLCSMSSVDQERNNISLFNVIEQCNIPADFFVQQEKEKKNLIFPFSYEIVLYWRRALDVAISGEEIRADFKIKTVDPMGKVLQEILAPLTFPKGIKRVRSISKMQGMLISMVGDYAHHIEVRLPDHNAFKKVLEIPFEVKKTEPSL